MGEIFLGTVKIRKSCENCGISFDIYEKVGDISSWITSFFLSALLVPVILIMEIYSNFSLKQYIFFLIPLVIISSIILLRITKFYILYKYMKKNNNEN